MRQRCHARSQNCHRSLVPTNLGGLQLPFGNTLTVGLYLAYYEMDDEWGFGNHMLMTNEPNARPITVTYVAGGQTRQRTDSQGLLDGGGFNITENNHAFNKALYLSDSWRIDKWLATGAGGVLLARPIEGSEINVQAKYQW